MSEDQPRRKLSDAERAAGMFIRASRDFPAAVNWQGVKLALDCQKNGDDPKRLGQELVNDEGQITKIERAMRHAHTQARVREPISRDTIPEIVTDAFSAATLVAHAPRRQLADFLTRDYSGNMQQATAALNRLAERSLNRLESRSRI